MELSNEAVDAFTEKLLNYLLQRCSAAPAPPSATLVGHIRKRVPPRSFDTFANFSGAVRLLAEEIAIVGFRISRYRYLGEYRDYFTPPSNEMDRAFITHLHDLRPAELYIILERGIETLRFASLLASELGIASQLQAKSFSNSFKKKLERRLRERHRITHAHERRSMSSLLLDLPAPKTDEERRLIGHALTEIVAKMVEMWNMLKGKGSVEAQDAIQIDDVRKVHLDAFEEEASFMWETFSDHLIKTFPSPD